MEVIISDEIKALCPEAALGVLSYCAEVQKSPAELLQLFETTVRQLESQYGLQDIAGLPNIQDTRRAYKALGKSVHEYRNAAEAMLRRIVKGNGLYQINNVVDINNLISVSSGYSIGVYATGCLLGQVELCRAPAGEKYEGIGKAAVNIEYLPTLYDDRGAFGNPTSDSQRAMIQPGQHKIMSVIYSFNGTTNLKQWLQQYSELLVQYCRAENVQTKVLT